MGSRPAKSRLLPQGKVPKAPPGDPTKASPQGKARGVPEKADPVPDSLLDTPIPAVPFAPHSLLDLPKENLSRVGGVDWCKGRHFVTFDHFVGDIGSGCHLASRVPHAIR